MTNQFDHHSDTEHYTPTKPHSHTDEHGVVHWCYHKCRNNILSGSFWMGVTLSFPLEHLIWTTWPLSLITKWLGLEL